jgi:hypothetical protein
MSLLPAMVSIPEQRRMWEQSCVAVASRLVDPDVQIGLLAAISSGVPSSELAMRWGYNQDLSRLHGTAGFVAR